MALTKALAGQWQQTKESWRDAKCDEFERRYMVELQAEVDRAVHVMEEIDRVLRKVRSDCE